MNPLWNEVGVGWRMALVGVCLVGLVACAAVLDGRKVKGPAPEREATSERPAIDVAEPTETETATFALG